MEKKIVLVAAVSLITGVLLAIFGAQNIGYFGQSDSVTGSLPDPVLVYRDPFYCEEGCDIDDDSRFTWGENDYVKDDGIQLLDQLFYPENADAWTIFNHDVDSQDYGPYAFKMEAGANDTYAYTVELELPHEVQVEGENIRRPIYRILFDWWPRNLEAYNAETEFRIKQEPYIRSSEDYASIGGNTCTRVGPGEAGNFTGYSQYPDVFITADNPECRYLFPGRIRLTWRLQKGSYEPGNPHPPQTLVDNIRIQVSGQGKLEGTIGYMNETVDWLR